MQTAAAPQQTSSLAVRRWELLQFGAAREDITVTYKSALASGSLVLHTEICDLQEEALMIFILYSGINIHFGI